MISRTPAPQRLKSSTPARGAAQRPASSSTAGRPAWQSIRSKTPSAGRSPASTAGAPRQAAHFQPQLHATPRNIGDSASAPPAEPGEQLQLFQKLQSVVVQLSQCAVSEKHKYSHLQKRLDAYAQLVREQDRMIEELKALNSRLVKEKEALLSFRREGDEGEEEAWLAAGGSAAEAATGQQTPKSKEFAASLVAQLRDEKRQRLAVEEQSSRMIGEQQVTIHRLEEKLKQSAVSHVSPHRNSHGAARQAAQSPGSRPLPNRPIVPAVHVAPAQSQDSAAPVGAAGRGGTAVSASESLAAGSAKAADSAADRHLASSFTPLFSGGTTSTLTSMEDATAILQQIRRRHGL